MAEKQDGSADDFQEAPVTDEKRALKKAFIMDKALEDKICDLYDLYVEVINEVLGIISFYFHMIIMVERIEGHTKCSGFTFSYIHHLFYIVGITL